MTPIPTPGAPPPPSTPTGRQLEILARQLIAQRANLEATKVAVVATIDAAIAALDPAFAMLNALQIIDDTNAAAATLDTPPEPTGPPRPKVFGQHAPSPQTEDSARG